VGCATKLMEDKDGMGYASRSKGLLHLEASQARVFQSGLKTGGGATWMFHGASSWRSCRDEVEDGGVDAMDCIGLDYPYFVVFSVLDTRSILVI
jgi:hypothetical protein